MDHLVEHADVEPELRRRIARPAQSVQEAAAPMVPAGGQPSAAPVLRLQRLAGNRATSLLLVSRQSVEEEPNGPGSLDQAPAAAAQQLPSMDGGTAAGEQGTAEASDAGAAAGAGGVPAGPTGDLDGATTGMAPTEQPAGPASDVTTDTSGPATGGSGTATPTSGGETAPASVHRQLSWGLTGPDVTDLQHRLNDAGSATPPLALDGIFGPLTNAAVRQYQGAHPPLKVDGIVGPKTWAVLDTPGGGGGGGGGGVQPADPLAGICTINGHGASDAAVNRAREQAIELYGNLTAANRARMAADPITVDVIPHDKKLTELPEYQHLAGTQTFDGRLWDTVRGIQTEVNGVRRVAVAEEDLTTVAGKSASYGDGFLEAHEGGHGLQFSGLTVAQQTQLQALYAARLATQGQPTQTTPEGPATAGWLRPAWYSAANKEEYFANSVAAYHGHPYTNGAADVAQYNRSWLQANDPQMYALIDSLYAAGPAPASGGGSTGVDATGGAPSGTGGTP